MFLLKKFRKKVESSDKVGIAISEEGIAISHVIPPKIGGKSYLNLARFYNVTNPDEYSSKVKEAVEEAGLNKKSCVLSIPASQYDCYLMEPPEVDEKEMASALVWQVKDYLDYPVENAAVDFFEVPMPKGSEKKMIYAVAANKRYIEQQVAWINLLGLDVEAVTIPELALRNIVYGIDESKEGLAIVHPGMHRSEVVIVKDGFVYMLRNANVDLSSIIKEGYEMDEGVLDQLLEELSLEIQRALDYCVSRLQHHPVQHLIVAPQAVDTVEQSDKYKSVEKKVGVPTRIMKLDEVLDTNKDINYEQQSKTVISSGAALRYIDEMRKFK